MMTSDPALRIRACRPCPPELSLAMTGERRRLRCDRGAACRVLAGAATVAGAAPAVQKAAAGQLNAGLTAAEQHWRGLTPAAKTQALDAWSAARNKAYPRVTWPLAEVETRLRSSVTADLSVLAAERIGGLVGKERALAEGERARVVRTLTPAGHQMGGGALLYLRRELDRLAALRNAAGQPIAHCPNCGQFIGREAHQCPTSTTVDEPVSAAADFQPPSALADYYAALDMRDQTKLAEPKEYPSLGTMTRAEFVTLAANSPDGYAYYSSSADKWAVQMGEHTYPVSRVELAAFADLASSRLATDVPSSDSPGIAAKLAANPATPPVVWQQMLEHPQPLVRAALASRRDAGGDTLTKLYSAALSNAAEDSDDEAILVDKLQNTTVRLQAVRNQNAPTELLRLAQHDPDRSVAEWAKRLYVPATPPTPPASSATPELLLSELQASPPVDDDAFVEQAAAVLGKYCQLRWRIKEPKTISHGGKLFVVGVEHTYGGRITRIIARDGSCYRYIDSSQLLYQIIATPTSVGYQYKPLTEEVTALVAKVGGLNRQHRDLERKRLSLQNSELHLFGHEYIDFMSVEEMESKWYPLHEPAPSSPILMTVQEELDLTALGKYTPVRELNEAENCYLAACRERLRLGSQGWIDQYQRWRNGGSDAERYHYQPQADWTANQRASYDAAWQEKWQENLRRIAESGYNAGRWSRRDAVTNDDAAWATSGWVSRLAALPADRVAEARAAFIAEFVVSQPTEELDEEEGAS